MEIDVRGEICPYPAMKAKETLQHLPAGETLDLITDHAPALQTVPWEGAKLGFTFAIEVAGPGQWRIHLERAAAPLDQKRVLREIAARANELAEA